MCLATPRPFGGERGQMRRRRDRQRERGRERSECVIARDARQIERLHLARGTVSYAWPSEETRPMRVAKKRKHHVAARIDVVNGNEQLAKTGLSKIVGEKFDIPPRQVVRLGRSDWRRSSDHVPDLRTRCRTEVPGGQGAPKPPPQDRRPCAPPHVCTHRRPAEVERK